MTSTVVWIFLLHCTQMFMLLLTGQFGSMDHMKDIQTVLCRYTLFCSNYIVVLSSDCKLFATATVKVLTYKFRKSFESTYCNMQLCKKCCQRLIG